MANLQNRIEKERSLPSVFENSFTLAASSSSHNSSSASSRHQSPNNNCDGDFDGGSRSYVTRLIEIPAEHKSHHESVQRMLSNSQEELEHFRLTENAATKKM